MTDLKLKIAPSGSNVLIRTMRRKGETIAEGTEDIEGTDAEGNKTFGLAIPEKHARQYQMSLCKVEAVGPGRLLPSGELAPMSCKPGDVVIVGAEPMHLPNEIDQELMAIVDDSQIRGAITGGLDEENYTVGITLYEEYQNAMAAKAEQEAAMGGNQIYQA